MKKKNLMLFVLQLAPLALLIVATYYGYSYFENIREPGDNSRTPGAFIVFMFFEVSFLFKRTARFLSAPRKRVLKEEALSYLDSFDDPIVNVEAKKMVPTMTYDLVITLSSKKKIRLDYFYGFNRQELSNVLTKFEEVKVRPTHNLGI